jgi:hypothetical protein
MEGNGMDEQPQSQAIRKSGRINLVFIKYKPA